MERRPVSGFVARQLAEHLHERSNEVANLMWQKALLDAELNPREWLLEDAHPFSSAEERSSSV